MKNRNVANKTKHLFPRKCFGESEDNCSGDYDIFIKS